MSGPKSQVLALKINGLYTDPNPFSELPAGITLEDAQNVVLDRDSVINSRRGFQQYGTSPTPAESGATKVQAIFDFKDTLILSDEVGNLKYDSSGDGSTWSTYSGTYLPPGGDAADRVASFQSNKNLYLATNEGVYKLTNPSSTPTRAGAPRGLGGSGATTGSTGFMLNDTNVAYRIVWGYRDANENLILGAPSDRIVVSNTSGGDRDVSLTFYVPEEITTSWFYQVYRSAGSASVNDSPDDELQLVEEASPTTSELSAGLVTITDSTPDNLRGVLIYTASSLSTAGITGANTRPPFCTSMCTFKNFAFYGNTRTAHSLFLTLISVGSPDGIQVGDTFTFSDGTETFTITGDTTENTSTGKFLVQTGLTPAENIDATARSIVKIINVYAANTFINAYYTSGFDDLPGQMYFERDDLSQTAFTVNSSRVTTWRPEIPSSGSNYNNTSRNEEAPNRVYFSKLQQPEAVPSLQYFNIGSPEEPIRALVPLRDGIIVIKTDGVYRISGSDVSTFTFNPLDTTVRILAKYSVAVLANKVFFLSAQGVVAASDTGVEIMSRSIESELLELSSALYPNFSAVTFAAGYESDRKYILWMQTTDADDYGTQAFVLNILTGTWTRWTRAATAAIVKQDDDKLYLAGPVAKSTDMYVMKERKNFNISDFADEQYIVNISAVSGKTLTVDDTSMLEVGYTIQQTLASSIITEIVDSNTIIVKTLEDWDTEAVTTAYRPIYQYFKTNQFDANQPGIMKHWADCSMVYRSTDFETMTLTFEADTTNEPRSVTLTAPSGAGGWGTFPWGLRPWGVSNSVRARIRTSVPKQAMRSNWITIAGSLNEAFTDMSVAGISLTYSGMSSRQKGGSA